MIDFESRYNNCHKARVSLLGRIASLDNQLAMAISGIKRFESMEHEGSILATNLLINIENERKKGEA